MTINKEDFEKRIKEAGLNLDNAELNILIEFINLEIDKVYSKIKNLEDQAFYAIKNLQHSKKK